MTYRLKDRALQSRLDDLTYGELTDAFKRDDWLIVSHEGDERLGIIEFGDFVGNSKERQYRLVFRIADIEEVSDEASGNF